MVFFNPNMAFFNPPVLTLAFCGFFLFPNSNLNVFQAVTKKQYDVNNYMLSLPISFLIKRRLAYWEIQNILPGLLQFIGI